ncbi:porin, partial [uncultured Parasutterella sp.]
MKLSLIAAGMLAAVSGTALAASNVTLYGVLDAGVTVSKQHGGSTLVNMSNGNWLGNRWGIKGEEELGGGNNVFF